MTPRNIGNRIFSRGLDAAENLLLNGAIPWEIDAAMVAFGFSTGPFAAQDLTGLDTAVSDPQNFPISARMVEMGRLGKKSGVGWYRYPGGGGAVEDPLLEDLIAEESYFAKITRRDFSDDEIRTHLMMSMINEAAMLLGHDTTLSCATIDRIMIEHHGFPKARGGLLRYGDTLGAKTLLETLATLARHDPVFWCPAPLIKRNADTGTGFYPA